MILGFTGTRSGMTAEQRETFARLLVELQPDVFVHGDCVGADADAHALALAADIPIHIRPCDHPARAWCASAAHLHEVKKPLDRNKDIVDDCGVLIATPWSAEEQVRSGTWFTVRYARKVGRKIHIINPDGTVTHEPAA